MWPFEGKAAKGKGCAQSDLGSKTLWCPQVLTSAGFEKCMLLAFAPRSQLDVAVVLQLPLWGNSGVSCMGEGFMAAEWRCSEGV